MPNEIKVAATTSLGSWNNWAITEVEAVFADHGVKLDSYSKQCAGSAMSYIWNLIQNTDNFDISKADTSNLFDMVLRCASLKLNASADPQEVYFQMRNKQVNGQWKKTIELVINTYGYEALLRHYGTNVSEVVGPMIVHEGDDFEPPQYIGFETKPPVWKPKYLSNKAMFVVYLVKLKGKKETYLISHRESVKKNLKAHVRNSLMNETFGLAKSRYDANAKQAEEIKQRKNAIMDALNQCETLDEMLACKEARPYMSAAWTDSTEDMIVRKMIKNCVKGFPKDYGDLGKDSINRIEMEADDAYRTSREEIDEHENSEPFIIDGEMTEVDG